MERNTKKTRESGSALGAFALLFVVFLFLIGPSALQAQASPAAINRSWVEAQEESLKTQSDLDPKERATRENLIALLSEYVETREKHRTRRADKQAASAKEANQLALIRVERARLKESELPDVSLWSQTRIDEELSKLKDKKLTLENGLGKQQGEKEAANLREESIKEEIAAIEARIARANELPDATIQENDSVAVRELKMALATIHAEARLSERAYLLAEQSYLPVHQNYLKESAELAELKIADIEPQIAIFERANADAVVKAAQGEIDTATQAKERLPSSLLGAFDRTIELRIESKDLALKLKELTGLRRERDNELRELEALDKRVRERVKKGGTSDTIGVILRNERRDLPDVSDLTELADVRRDVLENAQISIFKLETEIDKVESWNRGFAPQNRKEEVELKQARSAYEEALKALKTSYNTYLDELEVLKRKEATIVKLRDTILRFIDEHILWIQSTVRLSWSDVDTSLSALNWILGENGFRSIDLLDDLIRSPLPAGLAYLLSIVSFLLIRPILRRQKKLAKIVTNATAAPWRFTLQAWLLLVMRSLPWPLLMFVLAWRVSANDSSGFASDLSIALASTASVFFLLRFERALCRKGGVGEVHFDWHPEALALFRRHLFWLAILVLPTAFFVRLLSSSTSTVSPEYSNSLGRIAFVFQSLTLAVFTHITLRADSKALIGLKEKYIGVWIDRMGLIWYLIVVGSPITLAVLAFTGFYYTALELSFALIRSLVVFLVVMQANALTSRWFYLVARRMAIKRAKNRRRSEDLPPLSDAEIEEDKLTGIDIKQLRSESRSLRRIGFLIAFATGLYLIWSPILPALRFLDTIETWTYMTSDGAEKVVTLGDLISSVVIIVSTIIAVRTLPGLVEATFLRRFKVDRGGRYAVKAIMRYVLIIFGTLMSFNAIGVQWGDVQWLVAGLSVGLGFGLQEIFANFISGLIMLFERPVRVGDTVTVGDISVTVTRINMRATTVLDWDRKELIVPNKMFVTDRLINWSLSDDVVRLIVKVGIAYGSDIDLARKTLIDLADKEPMVVNDPPPTVFFADFGDSTLNFELRVFVHGVDNWRLVKNNLNFRIDKQFHEAKIEIAFPQRVLHIAKDGNELEIRRQPEAEPTQETSKD